MHLLWVCKYSTIVYKTTLIWYSRVFHQLLNCSSVKRLALLMQSSKALIMNLPPKLTKSCYTIKKSSCQTEISGKNKSPRISSANISIAKKSPITLWCPEITLIHKRFSPKRSKMVRYTLPRYLCDLKCISRF